MIVDAHLHVWDLERAAYDWLGPDLAPIDRTVAFEEAIPQLRAAGVDRAVLVQAADHAEDTAAMLRVADRHPEVAGVVVWVPLDRPEEAAASLAALRRDPRVVGVRNLIHDRPDPGWILRDDVDAGLAVLEEADVPFDYVTASHVALEHLPRIIDRHPRLRIVVDHLGKPPIGGTREQRAGWRALLARAAEHPLVSAKLSGLYPASGAPSAWTPEDLRPFVDDAVDVLGPRRLMYGGDWPVSVLAGGYARVWAAITALLAPLGEADRDAVLGGTATRFYRLPGAASPSRETEQA